jgi:hypothetical protein
MVHRLDEANRIPGAEKPYNRTSRLGAQGDGGEPPKLSQSLSRYHELPFDSSQDYRFTSYANKLAQSMKKESDHCAGFPRSGFLGCHGLMLRRRIDMDAHAHCASPNQNLATRIARSSALDQSFQESRKNDCRGAAGSPMQCPVIKAYRAETLDRAGANG